MPANFDSKIPLYKSEFVRLTRLARKRGYRSARQMVLAVMLTPMKRTLKKYAGAGQ